MTATPACGGVLNPWNHPSTPHNRRIAVVVIALSAIAAVVGTLSLLPILSGSAGRFHTFTMIPKAGAFMLTIGGAAFTLLAFAWLATRDKSVPAMASIGKAEAPAESASAFSYPSQARDLSHHQSSDVEHFPERVNPNTFFKSPYPASAVLGGVYLISRTPENQASNVEQLAEKQRARIVIRLAPNSPQPRKEHSDSTSADLFTISDKRYRSVTFNRPCMDNITAAMEAIAELKNGLGEIVIDAEHPMLVLATDENESGAFVLLYELAQLVEEAGDVEDFVGSDFWEQVLHLAIKIESDSFGGAAVEWANQILKHFGYSRLYNPELSDSNPGHELNIDTLGIKLFLRGNLQQIFTKYLRMRNQ